MAKTRGKPVLDRTARTIATSWDHIPYCSFRLEGKWLVLDSMAGLPKRVGATAATRQLHRRLAEAVERRRGEVALKENWRQLAVEFANAVFPPVVEMRLSNDYRVPVARFGAEALLIWWMRYLRLQLVRGPQWGDLNKALQATVQVLWLTGQDHKEPLLWQPDRLGKAWIGLFGASVPKKRRPIDPLSQDPYSFRLTRDGVDKLQSLSSQGSEKIVRSLYAATKARQHQDVEQLEQRNKKSALRILHNQLQTQYGRLSLKDLALKGFLSRDPLSLSLDQLNALIKRESKRLLPKHRGVIQIGGPEDPELRLWRFAAQVFMSTLNRRMVGASLACQGRGSHVDTINLVPTLMFHTPLSRIWFDFWKELGGMVEVRSCEVCEDPYAAVRRQQRFCSPRCRKTAEMRSRRTGR